MTAKATKLYQAVLALLECGQIEKAAERADVSVSTFQRMMRTAAFQSLFADARRRTFEIGLSRLQAVSGEAVECLRSNLKTGPAGVRVRAASAILLHATRAAELLDITARLDALEAQRREKEDT